MEDFRNEYCMHTATCGQLRATDVNQEVTLCGWAWHTRDHGGLIFIDLRDRDGYTQVVVDPDCVSEEDFHAAEHLGREYVLKVSGRVRERAPEAINPNMITGEIEVLANAVEVLNTSVTPPFSIEDGIETDEITRMKWRYLDIRRPEMLANLKLRHTVTQAMRRALDERGFLEIETPILANSTPEGARDYIVPSRPNPGKFYALPQSPQIFKQLLMVGGVDKYYQIARCFRDEDLRADRQPEFTQVDIEMSFVEGDDVCDMMEGVMAETLKAVGVTDVAFPLQKMQYADAMRLYGCDRPDVRFGMLLHDITDIVKDTGFKVFASVAQSGGVVKAINVKGAGDWSRGEVEKLASIAEANGAKGMAWVAFTTDGQEKSPIKKFFTDEEWAALKAEMEVEPGDLLLFAADKPEIANAVLSALARSELEHLSVYTEVMQDAVVELIDAGKVACASGTALTISPSARERFYAHIDDYKGKIILRPQELSNAPEVIRRLSIIAMNTAIEVDLAGNVNSTHIGEGAVMNGIGGSGDYARNSGIAIFSTASTAKDGAISCIVPHVAHVDHTEHDTEIIVTEQGLADLRGLTAYERAHVLIENCAHPKFRPGLREYVEQAYAQSKAKHGIIRL